MTDEERVKFVANGIAGNDHELEKRMKISYDKKLITSRFDIIDLE